MLDKDENNEHCRKPKVNQQKLNQAIAMYHSQRMAGKELQEATDVSTATIYLELKKSKIKFALFFTLIFIFCKDFLFFVKL
jgi:hypothetical protein